MAGKGNGISGLVAQQGKSLARERTGDYRVSLSALTAAQGNARNQAGLIAGGLRGTNRAVGRSLANLTRKAAGVQRSVAQAEAGQVNTFGGALSKAIGSKYAVARTGANQGAKVQASLAGEGKGVAAAGNTAIALGAQEQGAQFDAAKSALAQALMARTTVDNTTIAQLEGTMKQTALQYKLQLQNFEKEAEITKNGLPSDSKVTAARLASEGASVAVDAKDYWRTYQEGGKVDITKAVAQYQTDNGIVNLDDPRLAVFQHMMQDMNRVSHGGDNKVYVGAAYRSAIQELYAGQPGFTPKLLDHMMNAADFEDNIRQQLLALQSINSSSSDVPNQGNTTFTRYGGYSGGRSISRF
jgi:hypothetical protein